LVEHQITFASECGGEAFNWSVKSVLRSESFDDRTSSHLGVAGSSPAGPIKIGSLRSVLSIHGFPLPIELFKFFGFPEAAGSAFAPARVVAMPAATPAEHVGFLLFFPE
jgi:hypothetical protein